MEERKRARDDSAPEQGPAQPPPDAAAPKAPKRVVLPQPAPLNTTPSATATNSHEPAESGHPQAKDDDDEVADVADVADDSADEDERQQELRKMSDEEKQELVDRVLNAEDTADRLTHMLEGGPPERMLGDPHPAVIEERLQVEALGVHQATCAHGECVEPGGDALRGRRWMHWWIGVGSLP